MMLGGVFGPLWDIKDGEDFARGVCDKALRNRNIDIYSYHRREDLLADLVFTLWRLSGLDAELKPIVPRPQYAYDPSYGTSFQKWGGIRLYYAVIDWIRRTQGRTTWRFAEHTYERPPRPALLSLNGAAASGDDFLSKDLRGSSMGAAFGSSGLDPAAYSTPDLKRVLERGDSPEAWEAAAVDEQAPRRAA
jgi:hypothetical protein